MKRLSYPASACGIAYMSPAFTYAILRGLLGTSLAEAIKAHSGRGRSPICARLMEVYFGSVVKY